MARGGKTRNTVRLVDKTHEEKRTLRRPMRRWEDNKKIDLKSIGQQGVEWSNLAQNGDEWRAVVSTVMNIWVQKIARNFTS